MVVIIDWLEPSKSKEQKCCPSSSYAATVLASEGVTTLKKNVPVLSDVFTMNNVVRGLNAQVTFNEEDNTVVVDAQAKLSEEAPCKYVSKMRASIVVLGPVLARNGHAKVSCLRLYDRWVVRLTSISKVWKLWG